MIKKPKNVSELIPSRGYVDSDGVRRGFYVYVHRNTRTGAVFYVGKGIDSRGWSIEGRNSYWVSYVEQLDGDWEVIIVQDDLTENEAFDIEEKLIEAHGGAAAAGGSLTNWTAYGESLNAKIQVACDDCGYAFEYQKLRQFKKLKRIEQEDLVNAISEVIDPIADSLGDLWDEAVDSEEKIEEDHSFITSIIDQLRFLCRELRLRRISFHKFALGLESELDVVRDEFGEMTTRWHKVRDFIYETAAVLSRTMLRIDSGNRSEASESALRKATANEMRERRDHV